MEIRASNDTQLQDTFSARLSKLMKDHGESHAEVGRIVGVSGQAVGKWAKGGNIEFDNLKSLATHYDVNWIWLRYGDDAMQSFTERRTGSKARRAVIKEIMQNEERMRIALGAAQIGAWDLDLVADQLVLSPEARELLNIEESGSAGAKSDLLKCVAEADRERLAGLLEQALENRIERFDLTHGIVGSDRKLRLRGQVLRDDISRPVRLVGLVNIL